MGRLKCAKQKAFTIKLENDIDAIKQSHPKHVSYLESLDYTTVAEQVCPFLV